MYNWASSVDRIQPAAFALRENNTDGSILEKSTEESLSQPPFNFKPEMAKIIIEEYKGARDLYSVMNFNIDDVLGDLSSFTAATPASSTSATTTTNAASPTAKNRNKNPNFFYLQPNANGKHITYLSTMSSAQHASLTSAHGSSIYRKTSPTPHYGAQKQQPRPQETVALKPANAPAAKTAPKQANVVEMKPANVVELKPAAATPAVPAVVEMKPANVVEMKPANPTPAVVEMKPANVVELKPAAPAVVEMKPANPTPAVVEMKPANVVEMKPANVAPAVVELKPAAPAVIELKPAETTPAVIELKPAETTPAVIELKPAETTPAVIELKPAEATPAVIELKPAEEPSKTDSQKEKEEPKEEKLKEESKEDSPKKEEEKPKEESAPQDTPAATTPTPTPTPAPTPSSTPLTSSQGSDAGTSASSPRPAAHVSGSNRPKSKFFFGSSHSDKGGSSESPEPSKLGKLTRMLRPRSSSPGELGNGVTPDGTPVPPGVGDLRGDPEALKAAIQEMDAHAAGAEFKDDWTSRPLPWDAWVPGFCGCVSEEVKAASLIAPECTLGGYIIEFGGMDCVKRNVPDLGRTVVMGEEEVDFYSSFIAPFPHETYVFPTVPAVVSLLAPTGKQGPCFSKVIVRTPEADKRSLVAFEKKGGTIKAVMPDMWPWGNLDKSATLESSLVRYDMVQRPAKNFKFGVLYVKPNQTDENDIFGNMGKDTSDDYNDFLAFLGEKVALKGWSKYCGGLDSAVDATGSHSVFTEFKGHEIMFHVGTMLPDQEHDEQKVEKKRHIGNDVVVIVFKERASADDRFDPRILTSHFNHCFFVVSVEKKDEAGKATHYRMSVGFKPGVPPTQPYLPQSNVYEKNADFRELLFTKCKKKTYFSIFISIFIYLFIVFIVLNCERAALYNATEFSSFASSRKEYIESLCKASK